MSVRLTGKSKSLVVVLMVVSLSSYVICSEPPRHDYPVFAREMMRRLYPGLSENAELVYRDISSWSDSSPMNVFGMEIYERPPCCIGGVPVTGVPSEALVEPTRESSASVNAEFTFCVGARLSGEELLEVDVYGSYVMRRSEDFLKMLATHPEWSDSQIAQELKRAGAKFGPRNRAALLEALPLTELRPFLGELHVSSAEFVFLRGQEEPSHLFWRVKVATPCKQKGKNESFVLLVEPFDGRLLQISRE